MIAGSLSLEQKLLLGLLPIFWEYYRAENVFLDLRCPFLWYPAFGENADVDVNQLCFLFVDLVCHGHSTETASWGSCILQAERKQHFLHYVFLYFTDPKILVYIISYT